MSREFFLECQAKVEMSYLVNMQMSLVGELHSGFAISFSTDDLSKVSVVDCTISDLLWELSSSPVSPYFYTSKDG